MDVPSDKGKWEMGNGKWEMGNGKWEMGNGKWEMDSLKNEHPEKQTYPALYRTPTYWMAELTTTKNLPSECNYEQCRRRRDREI
jgi:hypothetical protein